MSTELIELPATSYLDEALLALRTRVLRAPLGLSYTPEQLAEEAGQQRLVVIIDGMLAGCILLARVNERTVKFRQMAVDDAFQGQGIGATLLHFAEAVARRNFYEQVELHARESALGFYERAGYTAIGEPFVEVTLPHRKMVKRL